MKKQLVLGLLAAFAASPALAALKVGDTAPDFTAQGSLGGKDFSFNLKTALKKGPVVVYFYPSAYTGGCDLEAHTFARLGQEMRIAIEPAGDESWARGAASRGVMTIR
jgi:thiol-disulfide isomerase/thioredoxin